MFESASAPGLIQLWGCAAKRSSSLERLPLQPAIRSPGSSRSTSQPGESGLPPTKLKSTLEGSSVDRAIDSQAGVLAPAIPATVRASCRTYVSMVSPHRGG